MSPYGAREFTMKFRLNNAAFAEDEGEEIARILRDVADKNETGAFGGNIKDINGNTVGEWERDDPREEDE